VVEAKIEALKALLPEIHIFEQGYAIQPDWLAEALIEFESLDS